MVHSCSGYNTILINKFEWALDKFNYTTIVQSHASLISRTTLNTNLMVGHRDSSVSPLAFRKWPNTELFTCYLIMRKSGEMYYKWYYPSCFNIDKKYFGILGWKIATGEQNMNFIHEQFNQYFTQKFQIRTGNLLHFFPKIYIWRMNLITNSCRLECLHQSFQPTSNGRFFGG